MQREQWMRRALELAMMAYEKGEVPVGAVVVCDGQIVGEGYNQCERNGCVTEHAELMAIREASQRLGTWRLDACELYVTMEPCPMCAGAICHSRIRRVIFGVTDVRAGAFGSVMQMNAYPFHRSVAVESGLLEDECRAILQSFFKEKRTKS